MHNANVKVPIMRQCTVYVSTPMERFQCAACVTGERLRLNYTPATVDAAHRRYYHAIDYFLFFLLTANK